MSVFSEHDRKRIERCVRIGLVNNMPDAALAGTERQFRVLLQQAAGDIPVELIWYSLRSVTRSESARTYMDFAGYRDSARIFSDGLDGVIVTGTEPRHDRFEQETYWDELSQVFDWLKREGPSAILSCLAAHAAVFFLDGIERRRLPEKRFGMFTETRVGDHRLTSRMDRSFCVAHSRWNEISTAELSASGYRVLTGAADAGSDLFIKGTDKPWLFFQGHPEYDPGALGREYRRDVRRFLAFERESYPDFPANYFDEASVATLHAFRERAHRQRCAGVFDEFPHIALIDLTADAWQPPAAPVFSAWLGTLAEPRDGHATRGWLPRRHRAATRNGAGSITLPTHAGYGIAVAGKG
jgi:homoserine O-succinyltransferase